MRCQICEIKQRIKFFTLTGETTCLNCYLKRINQLTTENFWKKTGKELEDTITSTFRKWKNITKIESKFLSEKIFNCFGLIAEQRKKLEDYRLLSWIQMLEDISSMANKSDLTAFLFVICMNMIQILFDAPVLENGKIVTNNLEDHESIRCNRCQESIHNIDTAVTSKDSSKTYHEVCYFLDQGKETIPIFSEIDREKIEQDFQLEGISAEMSLSALPIGVARRDKFDNMVKHISVLGLFPGYRLGGIYQELYLGVNMSPRDIYVLYDKDFFRSVTRYFGDSGFKRLDIFDWSTVEMFADPGFAARYDRMMGSSRQNQGCFIATAAYGSVLEPKLTVFREFRDTFLIPNKVGNKFVILYYKASPPFAKLLERSRVGKTIARSVLTPIYHLLNFKCRKNRS